MGSFTVGIISGSIVSAAASAEAVSGIADKSQEDRLIELNKRKGSRKGSVNEGNDSMPRLT